MIPERSADLDSLLAEVERQHFEVQDLFEPVSPEGATWRPDPTRWSMTGHLAHLAIVNGAYLESIDDAVGRTCGNGAVESAGPYRHPWLARKFARLLEPPPRRRVKTFRSMVPGADAEPARTVETFQALQRRLERSIEASRGLDLGAVRFGSPFFSLFKLSLGTAFEVVLAHNRRHVWLMRELMARQDFPG